MFEEEAAEFPSGRKEVRAPRKPLPSAPTGLRPSARTRTGAAILLAIALPLTIAGAAWSQWPSIASRFGASRADGRAASLSVISRPAGAHVTIDDQTRGVTPVTLQVPPGKHTVSVKLGNIERVMTFDASPGADILRDLDFAPAGVPDSEARKAAAETPAVVDAPPQPVVGWLAITAPFEVQLIERGEVIGTSAARRIMVPSGRHNLRVVNQLYEFEQARTVEVPPGQTTRISVRVPRVAVDIDAAPWAEVMLEGSSLGVTPILNVTMAIGSHRLVFSHPELGERQQDVVITSRTGQRVFADLTR